MTQINSEYNEYVYNHIVSFLKENRQDNFTHQQISRYITKLSPKVTRDTIKNLLNLEICKNNKFRKPKNLNGQLQIIKSDYYGKSLQSVQNRMLNLSMAVSEQETDEPESEEQASEAEQILEDPIENTFGESVTRDLIHDKINSTEDSESEDEQVQLKPVLKKRKKTSPPHKTKPTIKSKGKEPKRQEKLHKHVEESEEESSRFDAFPRESSTKLQTNETESEEEIPKNIVVKPPTPVKMKPRSRGLTKSKSTRRRSLSLVKKARARDKSKARKVAKETKISDKGKRSKRVKK